MAIQSISEQGFSYSHHIAEIVRYLRDNEKGFLLSEQLLGCGVKAGFCSRYAGQRKLVIQHMRDADDIIEMALHAGYLTQTQTIPIHAQRDCLLGQLHSL